MLASRRASHSATLIVFSEICESSVYNNKEEQTTWSGITDEMGWSAVAAVWGQMKIDACVVYVYSVYKSMKLFDLQGLL